MFLIMLNPKPLNPTLWAMQDSYIINCIILALVFRYLTHFPEP